MESYVGLYQQNVVIIKSVRYVAYNKWTVLNRGSILVDDLVILPCFNSESLPFLSCLLYLIMQIQVLFML